MRGIVAAVTFAVLLAMPALSQFEFGTIIEVVTDPSKAPVAGAAVEINPDARIGFAGVGRITSAGNPPIRQRTPRQIQFALKLYS